MTLRDLPIGKTATILSVGGEGALRQHFLDMGLIPKGEVTMVKYAPMGDPMELRIQRISRVRNVEEDAARSLIKKTDRQRANYYNFYADNDWGAADSYDVAINSGKLGVEKSIEVLAGICEHL